ncbi:glycosyltransferase [Kaistella flava (ex Peng et al. 2021)]|uniref:Glycosyltransferase n=1 Tax=Kaistella flava (ex Peng et al. 2021) TaxID=2038776 RepID=A0A7M2YBC7_9FLAO|nr:glycosyltransferase [Kaistella flava (ex Peng et al. 2021)]QOW10894.1 glycosyltransferase [Kaistella flava (ex Peng et al. 2021)]
MEGGSKKKKVLFRNRSMEMGGTENVLLTILTHLDKSKYDITLLLNYYQGEFLDRIPKEIRILSIGKGVDSLSKNKIIHFTQKTLRRIKYYIFQKNPTWFYKKHDLLNLDIEVAFSHYMYDDILNSPNRESKKVFWYHGDLRNSGFSFDDNIQIINKMKRFSAGVFVSYFSKNIVEKTWKVHLPNSQVIHNPMPIEEIFKKSELNELFDYGKIDFISLGRLFYQKGFKDLLNAHIRLIREGYSIKTLLIGEGSQKTELKQIISANHVEDSFILAGYHDNPFPYIKKAQFFVLPSYSEGYPLVIAEALLLNTYVLSTNVGGISEMIDSKDHGILFSPGEDNVYNAMKWALEREKNSGNKNIKEKLFNKNTKIFEQINSLFD